MLLDLDRISDLPRELAERIADCGGPDIITLDEAKKLRIDLMAERKVSDKSADWLIRQRTFNFCEH